MMSFPSARPSRRLLFAWKRSYVVTENSMVSEGKTSASKKLDSFSDELVVKRKIGARPYRAVM